MCPPYPHPLTHPKKTCVTPRDAQLKGSGEFNRSEVSAQKIIQMISAILMTMVDSAKHLSSRSFWPNTGFNREKVTNHSTDTTRENRATPPLPVKFTGDRKKHLVYATQVLNVTKQTVSGQNGREPGQLPELRWRQWRSRIAHSVSTRAAPHRDCAARCTEPAGRWGFTHTAGLHRSLSHTIPGPATPANGLEGSSTQRKGRSLKVPQGCSWHF